MFVCYRDRTLDRDGARESAVNLGEMASVRGLGRNVFAVQCGYNGSGLGARWGVCFFAVCWYRYRVPMVLDLTNVRKLQSKFDDRLDP